MATATATASSSMAHNPWDEEIVPALRKRLEAESQRLGKRMSRMLADDAVHPLGPMAWKDSAESKSRTLGKTSSGSARTQGSLRSASGPAPSAGSGRWDEAEHEEMPSGLPGIGAGGSGRQKNVEQAREKARRLRQASESANGSSSLATAQQEQRRRSRQVSEAQTDAMAAPNDEWDGFYEPTSSKGGAGASRSRTVSTPMKPSTSAARRREERERMERENQELFGSILKGEEAKENEAVSGARRKRAPQPGQGDEGEHLPNGSTANKVRRSTSQSVLQPSSSSVGLGSNAEAATTDSAWAPSDALRTPRKQQQLQQSGHDGMSNQLRPPVASPGFQSASAPVSPQAHRSRSTTAGASRRNRHGASAIEQQGEHDDFGPLGGTPRRQRFARDEDEELGDVSMQSNATHTSAWDEQLIPTVARRLQQQQLLAVAGPGGGSRGVAGDGEDGDVLIDTWDRKGMPLSASERAMKRKEKSERERMLKEQQEKKQQEHNMEAQKQQQQAQSAAPTKQAQDSTAKADSSLGHQWEGSHRHEVAQRHAAALLGGSHFDPESNVSNKTSKKKDKEDDVGAGCCKCSIM